MPQRQFSLSKPSTILRTSSKMNSTQASKPFLSFGQGVRDKSRLNSTLLYKSAGKFVRMIPDDGLTWDKWRMNGFVMSEANDRNFRIKIQKNGQNEDRRKEMQAFRIEQKIRQVHRLKEEVEQARKNQRLIDMIQDNQRRKVQTFFQELQSHIQN